MDATDGASPDEPRTPAAQAQFPNCLEQRENELIQVRRHGRKALEAEPAAPAPHEAEAAV